MKLYICYRYNDTPSLYYYSAILILHIYIYIYSYAIKQHNNIMRTFYIFDVSHYCNFKVSALLFVHLVSVVVVLRQHIVDFSYICSYCNIPGTLSAYASINIYTDIETYVSIHGYYRESLLRRPRV